MDATLPTRVALQLWGELRSVDEHGAPIELSNPRARACLALLAAAPQRNLSRERLSALLWGNRSDEQARANLRQLLYELKPLTQGAPPMIGFDRRAVWLEAACETDMQLLLRSNARELAVALPRRDVLFLADLDGISDEFDDWLASERASAEVALRRAVQQQLEFAYAHGDFESVRVLADAWASRDASDEMLSRFGLRADAALGDRAGHARRLRRLQSAMAIELGVKPAAETLAILRGVVGRPAGADRSAELPADAANPPAAGAAAAPSRPSASRAVALAAALLVALAGTLAVVHLRRDETGQGQHATAQRLTTTARGLSRARTRAGYSEAVALAQRAVASDPEYAPAWAELAFATWMQAGWKETRHPGSLPASRDEAAGYVTRALALRPGLGRALAVRSLIAGAEADPAWLEAAVVDSPDDAEAWLWLGNQRGRTGREREAMAAFRRAFELDPLWERSVAAYIGSASEFGEREAVDAALERFAAVSTNRYAIERLRGLVASQRGELAPAAQHFAAALSVAPDDPWVEIMELSNVARAVGDVDSVRRLASNHPELRSGLAPLYDPTGAVARADVDVDVWWNRGCAVDDMRNLLQARRGDVVLDLLARRKRPPLEAYEPDSGIIAAPYSMLAMVLRGAGREAEAAALVAAIRSQVERRAAQRFPHFTLELDTAALLALEGRPDQAVAALDRAVDKRWRGQIVDWAVDPGDEPVFAALRGRPDFERVRARLAAAIAQARPQVAAILAQTPTPVIKLAGDGEALARAH